MRPTSSFGRPFFSFVQFFPASFVFQMPPSGPPPIIWPTARRR
jgi:hypothetical protein